MMFDKFSNLPLAQTAGARPEENPYASPQTEGRLVAMYDPNAPVGIWRSGNALIMHADAELPERCILTNLKCDETERRVYLVNPVHLRNQLATILILVAMAVVAGAVAANRPAIRLRMILVCVGFVAVTAMAIWPYWKMRSDRVPIRYFYSHQARRRRLRWRRTGAIIFCLGLGCFPLIRPFHQFPVVMCGFFFGGPWLLLIGGVLFGKFSFPLRFEKQTGPHFLIHGCGKPFLMSFPETDLEASQLKMIPLSAHAASKNS